MTAIIMGLAVSSMHYIDMFTITYHAVPDNVYTETSAHGNNFIVISATIGMALLLGLLLLTSIIDRYVRYRTNYYDSLTILPNRRQFEKVLENASAQQTLAIWHVHDLEKINRENGYLFGDKVIKHVSHLLMSLTPSMTELYRIEGNRFAFFKRNLEGNDRMLDVTDWIIEQTCLQISRWRKKEISFGQVAINIPGQYVTSSRLLQVLKKTLYKYDFEPNMIELEIKETSFVKNIEEAMRAVSVLRHEGFSVALDDFGTGVSSLSYLKKIPISTLKIGKSFVDVVPLSEKYSSIIQAIIALGNSLNLSIVFEGVEAEEQPKFLASTCDQPIIQGCYFAKPMMPQELI